MLVGLSQDKGSLGLICDYCNQDRHHAADPVPDCERAQPDIKVSVPSCTTSCTTSCTLTSLSRCDSNTLSCTNAVFNQALLNDVHSHYNDPENAANPGQDSELLADFAKYLEATGFNHPATKATPMAPY